jgi:hypothetical protein
MWSRNIHVRPNFEVKVQVGARKVSLRELTIVRIMRRRWRTERGPKILCWRLPKRRLGSCALVRRRHGGTPSTNPFARISTPNLHTQKRYELHKGSNKELG